MFENKMPFDHGRAMLGRNSRKARHIGEIMATLDLTDENFRNVYRENDIVLVDFWAQWCGPCHAFAPIYEEVSEEFPEVVFGKVNTEIATDIAAHFGIRSIPTIMAIREQLEVFFRPGALSTNDLRQLVHQVKALDMDEVRRKVAEEENPS